MSDVESPNYHEMDHGELLETLAAKDAEIERLKQWVEDYSNESRKAHLRAEQVAAKQCADAERYRYIKINLRRLDIAGLCITAATAFQIDGRIDAARAGGEK